MLRVCAVVTLIGALVVPAAAADKYQFTLDASKSTITIQLPAFMGGGSTASPLVGTYSMMLDPPSGSWNVAASLDTVSATNTGQLSLSAPSYNIYVVSYPGDFKAMDWNQNKAAIPSTTLSGGPNISSSSSLSTAILVSIFNELNQAYVTANGAAGEWDLMNWNIAVSDADWIGVAGAGQVESHVRGSYMDKNYITYVADLYGRGDIVPEPATLGLLALSSLALLRRRPV